MKLKNNHIILNGTEYDNPLDWLPLKRKTGQYREWKETERTSFRSIWLSRYLFDGNEQKEYDSDELRISNRGKCFLDGKELKSSEDISTVNEIFSNLKVE